MMSLGIVPGVGQQLIEWQQVKGPGDGGRELEVIGLGTLVGQRTEVEVTAGVAKSRQLGIAGLLEPAALAVILAGVSGFVSGGVDGHLRGACGDQTLLAGQIDGALEELQEAPFLSILCSA
jgi:hypothetical protein